jgi:uncharacterized protein
MRGLGADARYWQALSAGRLEMQQCARCDHWHWPAVWRCSDCGSWEQKWQEVPLRGTIFAWTRTHHDFGAPPQYKLPFVSVVVTLDGAGHRRLMGTLQGDTSTVHIGARVAGEIGRVTVGDEELPALHWRMVEAGS